MIDLDNWLSGRYRISTPAEGQEKAGSTSGTSQAAKGNRVNEDLAHRNFQ